jgi:hypothetical protein
VFTFEGNLQTSGNLNFPSSTPPELWAASALEVRLADRLVLITVPRRNDELRRLFVTLPRSLTQENFSAPCKIEVKVRTSHANVVPRRQIVYPVSGVFRFTSTVKGEGKSTGIRAAVPAEYVRGMAHLGWGDLVNMRVRLRNGKWISIPGVQLRYYERNRSSPIGQVPLPRMYLPMLEANDQIEIELRRS